MFETKLLLNRTLEISARTHNFIAEKMYQRLSSSNAKNILHVKASAVTLYYTHKPTAFI